MHNWRRLRKWRLLLPDSTISDRPISRSDPERSSGSYIYPDATGITHCEKIQASRAAKEISQD